MPVDLLLRRLFVATQLFEGHPAHMFPFPSPPCFFVGRLQRIVFALLVPQISLYLQGPPAECSSVWHVLFEISKPGGVVSTCGCS